MRIIAVGSSPHHIRVSISVGPALNLSINVSCYNGKMQTRNSKLRAGNTIDGYGVSKRKQEATNHTHTHTSARALKMGIMKQIFFKNIKMK